MLRPDEFLPVETFAARLRQARKTAGLSQAELGQALGVSAQSVKEWEAGRSSPHFDRLPDIARVTRRSLAWFFQADPDGDSLAEQLGLALARAERIGQEVDGLRGLLAEASGVKPAWAFYLEWAEDVLAEARGRLRPEHHARLVDQLARGRWEWEGG